MSKEDWLKQLLDGKIGKQSPSSAAYYAYFNGTFWSSYNKEFHGRSKCDTNFIQEDRNFTIIN